MSGKAAGEKREKAASLRLDKLLAREGFGTRSELGKAIRKGRVCVNGAIVKDPGLRVSEEDEVLFDQRAVLQESYVYYMLNKPAGVVSATEDSREQTVLDLLRNPSGIKYAALGSGEDVSSGLAAEPVLRRGLFPVGRLDKDTEGLLLITDDGQLAHRLLAPGKHVDKTYYALVSGRVTEEDIRAFEDGIEVDGEFTAMPALLSTDLDEEAFAGLFPSNIREILPLEVKGAFRHPILRMAQQHIHQGALAGAIWPQNHVHLPLAQGEAHPLQDFLVLHPRMKVLHFQQLLHNALLQSMLIIGNIYRIP